MQNKAYYHRLYKQNSPTKYYVYVHYKKGTNIPFYVGKGSGYRAWSLRERNPYWKRVAEKYGYEVDVVFDNLTEDESYELEKDVVKEFKYFGYKLSNLTDGGDGGLNPSDKTRHLMSLAKKGKQPHNFGKKQPTTAGRNNPSADNKEYSFVREDGETFTGTRYDLCEEYNLKLSAIGKLFYKSDPRNKIFGWSIVKHDS